MTPRRHPRAHHTPILCPYFAILRRHLRAHHTPILSSPRTRGSYQEYYEDRHLNSGFPRPVHRDHSNSRCQFLYHFGNRGQTTFFNDSLRPALYIKKTWSVPYFATILSSPRTRGSYQEYYEDRHLNSGFPLTLYPDHSNLMWQFLCHADRNFDVSGMRDKSIFR